MQIVTDAAATWAVTRPNVGEDFEPDAKAHSAFWRAGADLLAALPAKPNRNPDQVRTAATVLRTGRESRDAFMRKHAETIYDALTKHRTTFLRAGELVYAASALVPGLVPTREQVAGEYALPQSEKDGVEVDQGIFFSNILAHRKIGMHLCHAMLLPKPNSRRAACRVRRERHDRFRHRVDYARRQGVGRPDEESALPQRRGRIDAAERRDRGRPRAP